MLGYYVDDIAQRLAARQENEGWQVILLYSHTIQTHLPTLPFSRRSKQHSTALCPCKKQWTLKKHHTSDDSLALKSSDGSRRRDMGGCAAQRWVLSVSTAFLPRCVSVAAYIYSHKPHRHLRDMVRQPGSRLLTIKLKFKLKPVLQLNLELGPPDDGSGVRRRGADGPFSVSPGCARIAESV